MDDLKEKIMFFIFLIATIGIFISVIGIVVLFITYMWNDDFNVMFWLKVCATTLVPSVLVSNLINVFYLD